MFQGNGDVGTGRRHRTSSQGTSQGTSSDRLGSLQAAGCAQAGFYAPIRAGIELAVGKETRVIDGRKYVFDLPLKADWRMASF